MTYVPRPKTDGKGKTLQKQEHYTVLKQPESEYLTHFTPDSGKAKDVAENLKQTVIKYNFVPCLKVIGGDSTAVNTGRKGGAITLLEKELDRRLVWLICLLHVNELPLRHLFVDLDDPTQGDKAFKGPIAKILKHVEEYSKQISLQ